MATPQVVEKKPNIEAVSYGRLTWLNIEKPTPQETEYLAQNYPFHPLDLDDCLSRVQRPKIDEYEDYLFMVFHFPVFNKVTRVTTPSQVSIFLGEDYLITLHAGDLKPLVKLFRECQMEEQVREQTMGHSSGYLLYRILDRLVDYCFPILNKVVANIEEVEDRIFSDTARGAVKDISVLRRDILHYRRIIRPQVEVFESLEQRERPFLREDPEIYFGDIADHIRKLRDTLEDYKEIVEGLTDTTNALTSFRINQVMRFLTIISVIMLPLTVIASIYGMNFTRMPFLNSPSAFAVTLVVMFLIVVGMLTFFKVRRWI